MNVAGIIPATTGGAADVGEQTSANKRRKANVGDERHRFLGSFSDLGVCNVTRATYLTAFASEAVPETRAHELPPSDQP